MLPEDFPTPPHVVTEAWQAVPGDVLLPVDYADWLGASLSILVAALHHPEVLAERQPGTDAREVATQVLEELTELRLAARTAERQQRPDEETVGRRLRVDRRCDFGYLRVSPGSELLSLGLNLEIFARAVLHPNSDDARAARGAIAYSAAAWSRELGRAIGDPPHAGGAPARGDGPASPEQPSSPSPW